VTRGRREVPGAVGSSFSTATSIDHRDVTTDETLTGQPAASAIPQLMDDYADHVYGLGLRMCDDPEKAEDLVQETFLRALEGWEGFDGRSKPSTWLYTIAARTCQRMERRRAGQPRHMRRLDRPRPGAEAAMVELPAGGETPLEWLERKEIVHAVRSAIESLPMHFRLPLLLKEIEGLSVEEVAEVLGLKAATVKTRLHRARLLVREALSKPLPKRAPGQVHENEGACLDLLWAKQEALDRGVDFPIPGDELCERCRSVFATLEVAGDVCHAMGDAKLPDEARQRLERKVLGEGG
jgi:RNA polymerase sigma-70 factor (ECF subfamily)